MTHTRRHKLLHKVIRLNKRTTRHARKATKYEFAHGKRPLAVLMVEGVAALRKAADLFAVVGAAQ